MTEVISARKKELLAQKQKLLDSIRYFDEKIEEVRQNESQVFYEDEDRCGEVRMDCQLAGIRNYLKLNEKDSYIAGSFLPEHVDISFSDSDSYLCAPENKGPGIYELKAQESQLSICLKATQELTQLEVLQYEMNVLVEPPQLQNGAGSSEPGMWREVTADCRVDLVPFSLSFHFFKPSRKFAALSYHNLSVKALKPAHEVELSKSVLANVTTPSDAVQIMHSYAVANRSRRATLFALYDKYEHLSVERPPEGGFFLKMGSLLDMWWTLENRWSPITDFIHRLKVNLEFLGESYIKILRRIHKQVSDPSLETDERTELMSHMLDVLLEAGGATSNVESDNDSINKTRTTLDQEPEMPNVRKNTNKKQHAVPKNKIATQNKNSEIMGPPKELPKRAKGKENAPNDQIVKKTSDVFEKKKSGVKRPLESNEVRKDAVVSKENEKDDVAINRKKSKRSEVNTGDYIKKGNVDAVKDNKQKLSKLANKPDNTMSTKQSEENSDRTDEAQTLVPKSKVTKMPTNPQKKTKNNDDVNKQNKKLSTNPQKNIRNSSGTERTTQITIDQQNNVENIKAGTKQATKVSTGPRNNIENNKGITKQTKVAKANVGQKTKILEPVKRIQQEAAKYKPKKVAKADKLKAGKLDELKETPVDQLISGNIATALVTDAVADMSKKIKNKQNTTQITDKYSKQKSNENLQNKAKSTENTTKSTETINHVAATKMMKSQQIVAVTKIPKIVTNLPKKAGQNSQASSKMNKNVMNKPKLAQDVISKIPQKKIATTSEENLRKSENPLRISPRKQISSVKVALQGVVMKKTQKHAEPALKSSPRLVKKPGSTKQPILPSFKPKSVS